MEPPLRSKASAGTLIPSRSWSELPMRYPNSISLTEIWLSNRANLSSSPIPSRNLGTPVTLTAPLKPTRSVRMSPATKPVSNRSGLYTWTSANADADKHLLSWIICDSMFTQVHVNWCSAATKRNGPATEVNGVGGNADSVCVIVVRANIVRKENAMAVVVVQPRGSSVFTDVDGQCGRAGDFNITPVVAPEDVNINRFAVSISPRLLTRQRPEREFSYGGIGLRVRRGWCGGWSRCRGTDRCCWSGRRRAPPPPQLTVMSDVARVRHTPALTRRNGISMFNFPPVIGRLARIVTPIEPVWAPNSAGSGES